MRPHTVKACPHRHSPVPAYARHVNTFYQNSSPHRPTSPASPCVSTQRLLRLALEKEGTIRASRDTIARVLRSRPIAPNSETRQARIARGACTEKLRRFPDRRRGDVRTRAMLVSSLWPVRSTAPFRPSGLRAYDTAKIACFSPLRRSRGRPSPTTRLPPPQSVPSASMLCTRSSERGCQFALIQCPKIDVNRATRGRHHVYLSGAKRRLRDRPAPHLNRLGRRYSGLPLPSLRSRHRDLRAFAGVVRGSRRFGCQGQVRAIMLGNPGNFATH